MRVLVAEKIHDSGIEVLKQNGLEAISRYDMTVDELKIAVSEVDALIIRGRTKINRDILNHAPRLKVIGMHGIGLDHIDLVAANEQGVTVLNVPEGNVDSTAELTMALMFAVARKIVPAVCHVKNGGWNTNQYIGMQLKGKTLGIIALGKIGTRVASIASALGMHVLAFDPHYNGKASNALLTTWEHLLATADVLTIHAPLTPDTKYLIADEEIARMKNGIIIINAARGGILSEKAAVKGLLSGKIRGIGMDVTETEPPGQECELLQFDNVIVTPHIGARTDEAQVYVSRAITQKVATALIEGPSSSRHPRNHISSTSSARKPTDCSMGASVECVREFV